MFSELEAASECRSLTPNHSELIVTYSPRHASNSAANDRCGQAETRRGVVLMVVVVSIVVLLGFAALVIDVGIMYNARADLQHAADATALAAAVQLPDEGAAIATALQYAERNGGAYGDVLRSADIRIGHWDVDLEQFIWGGEPRDSLRVTFRRAHENGNEVGLTFAHLFGKSHVNVSASATALRGNNKGGRPFPARRRSL